VPEREACVGVLGKEEEGWFGDSGTEALGLVFRRFEELDRGEPKGEVGALEEVSKGLALIANGLED